MIFTQFLIIGLVFALLGYKRIDCIKDTYLKNLSETLLNGYNADIVPILDENSPLEVKLDFTISQILEVNDQQETIKMSAWLNLEWNDFNLVWDSSLYNGIKKIHMSADKIWKPDIFLYNAADKDSWDQWSTSNVLISVFNNGSVRATPPSILISSCSLDIVNFPYDERNCKLVFGSWSYSLDILNLTIGKKVYLDSFTTNGGWNLENAILSLKNQTYEDEDREVIYPLISVNVFLRRRTLYYSFNIVLPCFLITILSAYGYTLPCESGEKVGLQVTNLLAVVFYIQYISTIIPPSSIGVSKISLYLILMTILCMMSVIGNVFVINLYYTDVRINKPMPIWFETLVCNYLARLLKMKKRKVESEIYKLAAKNHQINFSSIDFKDSIISLEKLTAYKEAKLNLLRSIYDDVKSMKSKFDDEHIEEDKRLKWKFAALVMDRLFLYLSLVYFIVTFSSLMLTIPNFYKPK